MNVYINVHNDGENEITVSRHLFIQIRRTGLIYLHVTTEGC